MMGNLRRIAIGFIGGGRMAEALIRGLLSSKIVSVPQIKVSDTDYDRRREIEKRYLVSVYDDNQRVASLSEVVILAVKPQNMAEVLSEVAGRGSQVTSRKLIISIAAGILLSYLQKKLPGFPIIRAMPNNPCLVGKGITALAKGKKVTGRESRVARKIFESVGQVVEVPEKWMDAVTGLSGSGPAFVYLVIEAMIEAGKKLGMTKSISEKLAVQTVLGSAKTMLVTGKSAKELREMVTSPGGTTVEGLRVLEKNKFKDTLIKAIIAASKKSKVLSKKWAR